MSDSSALVTVAMLSTLFGERHNDYLDIISPFVLTLLPPKVGSRVDIEAIAAELKNKFGFEGFPIQVITKILNRYSKQKFGYLERSDRCFYVKKPYERLGFTENQQRIRDAQSLVMTQLQEHLQRVPKYKNISIERTQDIFLMFLEQKGLVFVDGVQNLKTVTSKNQEIYQVARFVLDEYEKKSSIYLRIEEVVRGFFVYKSIYFHGQEGKESLTTNLRATTVFFDTRLLIEVLGYNTKEGNIAANELVSLIRECGGKVKTFSHLVDEVTGILNAFIKPYSVKTTFSLQYLIDNKYSEIDVKRLIGSLNVNLKAKGIEILDPVPYHELHLDEFTPLQLSDLSSEIQGVYGQPEKTSRTDNDVLTVASIYRLRGNARCTSLEDCHSVMATTNQGFVRTVRNFYKEKLRHAVHYVMNDVDLASILWLQSSDKKSNLPSIILLENAYAACRPTPELLAVFGENVEKLRGEGKLTDEEALLFRASRFFYDNLLDISENDPSVVTEKTVMEIKKRYEEAIVSPLSDKIVALEAETRKVMKREQDRYHRMISDAEESANSSADTYANKLKTLATIVFVILLIAGTIALIISEFSAEYALIWKLPLVLIGVIGLLELYRSGNSFLLKAIRRARDRRFRIVHDKLVDKVNRDFGITE